MTSPVGLKYSPAVYVVLLGAVFTEINESVFVLDEAIPILILEHVATELELLIILKYLYPLRL